MQLPHVADKLRKIVEIAQEQLCVLRDLFVAGRQGDGCARDVDVFQTGDAQPGELCLFVGSHERHLRDRLTEIGRNGYAALLVGLGNGVQRRRQRVAQLHDLAHAVLEGGLARTLAFDEQNGVVTAVWLQGWHVQRLDLHFVEPLTIGQGDVLDRTLRDFFEHVRVVRPGLGIVAERHQGFGLIATQSRQRQIGRADKHAPARIAGITGAFQHEQLGVGDVAALENPEFDAPLFDPGNDRFAAIVPQTLDRLNCCFGGVLLIGNNGARAAQQHLAAEHAVDVLEIKLFEQAHDGRHAD